MPRPKTRLRTLFELFDPEVRGTVVLAQAAAKKAGSAEIGHEHLLTGMLAEPAGLASRLLDAVGADVDSLSGRLQEKLGSPNPTSERPRLSREARRAIRAARRRTPTSTEHIDSGRLLIALTLPLAGWAREPLRRAGASARALETAYRSGAAEHSSGIDPRSADWVWDYLPQSGRHLIEGDEAQAAGDLAAAIESFETALRVAKEDDLAPDGVGDIYPKLVQANLLAGNLDTALEWLDEGEHFLGTYRFDLERFSDLPDSEEVRDFVSDIGATVAIHLQDLRLQLIKDRAHVHLGRDEFDRVEETARRLIEAADEIGRLDALATGRSLRGLALAHKGGSDDEAERNLLASLEPPEHIDPVDVASRSYSLALLELMRGDWEKATSRAEEVEAFYLGLGLQWSVTVARVAKAEAAVMAGGALPSTVFDEAERMDPTGKAKLLGWALRLRAIALRTTDPESSLAAVERAVELCRQHGHQLLLGRSLLDRGRTLAALGRDDEARPVFEESLEILRSLDSRLQYDARRELAGPDAE